MAYVCLVIKTFKLIIMTNEAVIQNVAAIPANSISSDVKTDFCKLWPTVKQGLTLLISVVPSLTFFINLVIAGGDALQKKICPGT